MQSTRASSIGTKMYAFRLMESDNDKISTGFNVSFSPRKFEMTKIMPLVQILNLKLASCYKKLNQKLLQLR